MCTQRTSPYSKPDMLSVTKNIIINKQQKQGAENLRTDVWLSIKSTRFEIFSLHVCLASKNQKILEGERKRMFRMTFASQASCKAAVIRPRVQSGEMLLQSLRGGERRRAMREASALHQNHCAHKGVSDLSNQAPETIDRMREREGERGTDSLKTVKWRQANNQFVLGWLGANHGPNTAQGPELAALILHSCLQRTCDGPPRQMGREGNKSAIGC